MQEKLLFNSTRLKWTLKRLCLELVENHGDFEDTLMIGLQPRGIYLAERLKQLIKQERSVDIPLGKLDITFYRDDFRRREKPLAASTTDIPFLIEKKRVILVDDVFYTGRSVRSALDALGDFGRAEQIEFLALIERKYSRELPIALDYVGVQVNTVDHQKVNVRFKEQGHPEDQIVIIQNE
ncbi:MAG: bifunctional pyr operon transcriptional regulator/uracil phosphoribosyltransferase PyrR [Cyclobacteriaceae bacterium]|nr:bifunctional pyr operon transcriptional regulator/uracil phosphoribosyltransferase PyrR [Cyclobacteriaceae bacterium]